MARKLADFAEKKLGWPSLTAFVGHGHDWRTARLQRENQPGAINQSSIHSHRKAFNRQS